MHEILTFSREELQLLKDVKRILKETNSALAAVVKRQAEDLELLAAIVNRAPSPTRNLLDELGQRDLNSLTLKMVNQGVDQVVNQPAKAVLGRGFTVSKLHLFGLLSKLTNSEESLFTYRWEVEEMYSDILFTLLAEDLYSSILANSDAEDPWVKGAAKELVEMWDYRTSANKEAFAPHIRTLWRARQTIVPVLGTLMGTIELMRLSSNLPEVWLSYLSATASEIGTTYALEEFLFDLSYEQIVKLRSYMAKERLAAISRQSAGEILERLHLDTASAENNLNTPTESQGMQLYRSFLRRNQRAMIRRYRQSEGPFRTLEEYFVIYLLTLQSEE